MKKFIVRRVLLGAMILFFVSMIIYSIERALPTSYVEGRARDMSMKQGAKPYDELVAELNAAYGLDKPVYVQLFMYLKNIPSLPAAECFAVGAAPSLIFDHGQTV